MGTERLQDPKGTLLQSMRLGTAFSGSLKTTGQFGGVRNTISGVSVLDKKLKISGLVRGLELV